MSELATATAQKQVEKGKTVTIEDHLRRYEPEFQRALGQSMDAAKFAQDALTAIKANPAIGTADVRSLFGALFLAAQLRLPVGGPLAQFHLTVRKVKGTPTVVPIIGYNGYIQLAMNTGLYSKVEAILVRDKDVFKRAANSERGQFYDLDYGDGDRGNVIGVIGSGKIKGFDETSWVYVDRETILNKHRPSYWKGTPWESNEDDQILKTAIRVWQKWVPKTAEAVALSLAAGADQAVVRKVDGVPDLQVSHENEPAAIAAPELDPAHPDYVEPQP